MASALSATEKEFKSREGTLCSRCDGIGYKGRIAICEFLHISPAIREALIQGKSAGRIEEIAVEEGMMTLKASGTKLVEKQLTTISELQKICPENT